MEYTVFCLSVAFCIGKFLIVDSSQNDDFAKSIVQLNSDLKAGYLKKDGSTTSASVVDDLNNFKTGICIFDAGIIKNAPPVSNWFLLISGGANDLRLQLAINFWANTTYKRYFAENKWSDWEQA